MPILQVRNAFRPGGTSGLHTPLITILPEAVPGLSCISCLQAKEMLEKAGFEKGGQAVVLGGATIAGFFAAACSLPFDFVKTRIQKMEPLPDGTLPYKVRLEA